MIPYSRQTINKKDLNSIKKVLFSDYLTQGPEVKKFEKDIQNYLDVDYALALNSATSALHVACLALGLEKDDWLWTVPNTFVASANCAKYCGAKVDFVDINNNTFNKNFVILHAGSNQNRKNKRWPFFDLLAAKLNSEGYEIVWVGGSDDKDVNEILSSKIGINTTGQFTIRELACLGKFAAFAVTNDSAPMHILSSCNIPVFGIFGPSNKNIHHAVGDKFRATSSEKSNVDIASISINKVWSELEQTKFL